ncbi:MULTISPECIES: ATP-binding protein [Streptomyces]|uniref:ATP-binding protein n=1 Tax=Streptomyces siderophoricus TaxID=2802281 RepID=A0ABS1N2W7_9ACTN|nr:ATP-binding protein [Streptomyces sp. 9-7]MBL1094290.1 ATP-binding protein [Streptomyces sp. 9-7]
MQKESHTLEPRTAFYRRERHSVSLAREFTRTALADWDLKQRAEDIVLCVSELATNALLHGVPPGRGYRLWLSLSEVANGTLRIEVHDSGGGEPCVPAAAVTGEAEAGRGLLLVAALADAWGIGERVPGKVVWCEFRRDGDGGDDGAGYGRP